MKEVKKMIPRDKGSIIQVCNTFREMVAEGKVVNVVVMVEFEDEWPRLLQAGEEDPVRVLGFMDWMKETWRGSQIYNGEAFDDDSG